MPNERSVDAHQSLDSLLPPLETSGASSNTLQRSMARGTGETSSTCDSVITFHRPYGAAPKSILAVGKTDAASVVRQIFVSSASATTFTVAFATTAGGADNTTYSFSYWVIE